MKAKEVSLVREWELEWVLALAKLLANFFNIADQATTPKEIVKIVAHHVLPMWPRFKVLLGMRT